LLLLLLSLLVLSRCSRARCAAAAPCWWKTHTASAQRLNLTAGGAWSNKDTWGEAFSASVKKTSIGVFFDHHMNFELHINKVAQSCFLQLRNIAKIKTVLSCLDHSKSFMIWSPPALTIVVHCSPPSVSSVSQPQLVPNAAARLNQYTSDHTLHQCWPIYIGYPFIFRMIFFTCKALHGLAPFYISELLCPLSTVISLRSFTFTFRTFDSFIRLTKSTFVEGVLNEAF